MTRTPAQPLDALATPAGVLCVLALDHRDAMRNVFARAELDASEAAMLELKSRITDTLARNTSAVMLDPQAIGPCRRPGIGIVVPLEKQGHQPFAGGRLTRLSENFGPAEAVALGADACKLLLYYRADHADTAEPQLELLRTVVANCRQHGLPLVVEPLVYRLTGEDETEYASAFGGHVVAAARDAASADPDLLKVQFPGDAETCKRLTKAAAPLNWVLLGGGDVDGETFAAQLDAACRNGACGFMAGRVIWAGAVSVPEDKQLDWLRREAVPLFERLNDIAQIHARRIR